MKNLVITTKSWKALIESLKANSKHGYNKLESLKQVDGYFTAVLCQDIDSAYVERLKIVTGHSETGEEEIGVKGLIDFLNHSFVPSDFVVKEELDESTQTEAVLTKIKRTTRKPKESK